MIQQLEKQPIVMDYHEADALAVAIYAFLISIAFGQKRLTEREIMSITPLSKVNKRLAARSLAERIKPKPKDFIFKLRYDELLAIHTCIICPAEGQKLQVVLGKIQQKVLNLNIKH